MNNSLFSIGCLLIVLGIGVRFLNKWQHYQFGVEARQALIEEAKTSGDSRKVAKLENEIYVIQKKLPIYGSLMVGLGVIILIASFIFKNT